jgi:predicted metal-dependent peptidase
MTSVYNLKRRYKPAPQVAPPSVSRAAAATERERLTHMRVQVHRMMPYLSALVYGMKPCARPGIGTMCVDTHGRCYYDPAFLNKLSDTEGAYVLIHEVCHLVLRHCQRMVKMLPHPSQDERETFNIAADLVVEQSMQALRRFAPKGGVVYSEYASKIPDLKPGLTVEEYYWLLQKAKEPPEGGEDGPGPVDMPNHDDAPGPLNPKNEGSVSDGDEKDYEEAGDTGMDDIRVDAQIRETDQAMKDYEGQGRGTVPGALKKAIDERLRPQPDPWNLLRSATSRAVSSTVGSPENTYRKRSRRQQKDGPLLKGTIHEQPKAVLVLDNSGSMCGLEDMCATVILQGLKRLKQIQVVAGDTQPNYDSLMTKLSQYEFTGGGGTDMGALIEHVDKEHRPDAIILVTDGYTPWPDHPTRARLVIALCADTDTPKWAKTIPVFTKKENA